MDRDKIIAGIVIGVIVIGGCTAALNDDTTAPDAKSTATAGAKDGSSEDTPTPEKPKEPEKTQAEQFTDCVTKTGTPTEKTAVKHVTKVTGADKRNNVLDSAEIYTDFTGGILGPEQGEAKLIASAFASCYESDNGLVTVYGEDGELIANSKF